MKFQVTMKDPDTLNDAIEEAVKEELSAIRGLDTDERLALQEAREEKVAAMAAQWFKYSEYLAIEIDTEAGTATVLPASSI